jgi:hypothetical protein
MENTVPIPDENLNELDQVPDAAPVPSRRHSWTVRIAAIMFGVGLVAASALAASHLGNRESLNAGATTGGQSTPTTTATDPSQSRLTPAQAEQAQQQLAQQQATGWVPYAASPGVPGVQVPTSAWLGGLSNNAIPFDAKAVGDQLRLPVYDSPNGKMIGYYYLGLGYIPAAMASDPTFDAAKARVAKYGCDIETDNACRDKYVAKQFTGN